VSVLGVLRRVGYYRGKRTTGAMPNGDFTEAEPAWHSDGLPYGHWTDGAVYGLEGQPPVAQSKGWGDLSWMRRHW
jgi:hypothetical protein